MRGRVSLHMTAEAGKASRMSCSLCSWYGCKAGWGAVQNGGSLLEHTRIFGGEGALASIRRNEANGTDSEECALEPPCLVDVLELNPLTRVATRRVSSGLVARRVPGRVASLSIVCFGGGGGPTMQW